MSKIEFQQLTPSVYYNQSRDFQFIGRLFDVVLNSVKMNADMIYNIPLTDDYDSKLSDLLALTLGLKLKHKYPAKQLSAICSCFSEVLRNKGSLVAVEMVVNALMSAEGLKQEYRCELNDNTLNIFVPYQLSDLSLLRDIMDYILPAGITCNIGILNYTASSADTKVGLSQHHQAAQETVILNKINTEDTEGIANIYMSTKGFIGASNIDKPGEE